MVELDDLNGVGPKSKQHLIDEHGIETAEDLAEADPEEISVPTGNAKELVNRAKQSTITSKSMADLLDEHDGLEYVPSGVEHIDEVLGGGWEPETIPLIYGKSGKGKSQLAFASIASAASEGSVAYLQTEMQSKSIAKRIATMAEDPSVLENVVFYEAYEVAEQYQTYEKIVEEVDDLVMIVVDSITAQFRMSEDFQGRNNLSDRSDELGNHLSKLGKIARDQEIPVLLTGQVYPTPEAYGKGDVPWGGEKMRHFVSHFIRISSGQGELTKVTLENHPGQSEEEILINIDDDGLRGVRIE